MLLKSLDTNLMLLKVLGPETKFDKGSFIIRKLMLLRVGLP